MKLLLFCFIASLAQSSATDPAVIEFAETMAAITGQDVNELIKTMEDTKAYNDKLDADKATAHTNGYKSPGLDIGGSTVAEDGEDDIIAVNEKSNISQYLYDGDVMLTPSQLFNLQNPSATAGEQYNHWPTDKRIYYFNKNSACSSSEIGNAIDGINQRTCIVFQRVYSESEADLVFLDKGACFSFMGKTSTRPQVVSLGNGCCSIHTITHELFHFLGAMHEQCRYDRDNYIDVYLQNVKDDQRHNFDRYSQHAFIGDKLTYDLTSVMQYSSKAFRKSSDVYSFLKKDGGVVPKNRQIQFSDWQELNEAYSCSAKACPNANFICVNNGYVHPRRCYECVCPDGTQSCKKSTGGVTDPQCGMNAPSQCPSPWTFKGKQYYGCSTVDNGDDCWCSLDAEYDGTWTKCVNPTETKNSEGCPKSQSGCASPFVYEGRTYADGCTKHDSLRCWCATSSTYNGGYKSC